jgi:diguanylate cyclase (GGDEF)-like protein
MNFDSSKINNNEDARPNFESSGQSIASSQSTSRSEQTAKKNEPVTESESSQKMLMTQNNISSKTEDVFEENENEATFDYSTIALPVSFSELADTPITYFTNETLTSTLLDKNFKEACVETLRFLASQHHFSKLAWLECTNNLFAPFFVSEEFADLTSTLKTALNDLTLQRAVGNMTSWQFIKHSPLEIFPLSVGNNVRAALVIGDTIVDDDQRRQITYFCQEVAISIEVLRLREELTKRADIVRAVQLFNEKLNFLDGEDTFDLLMNTCADLLQAERGSLLIYDEVKQQLKVQAAIGHQADKLRKMSTVSGERIADQVCRVAKSILVEDVELISLSPAPVDREYRSKSFICFPLVIGNRIVGVLNVTEKRSGASYNQNDLKLLEAIAPQLAIAVDRATLERKAGQLEQLSITDGLTGLLNRRYLNERLSEEVNRSQSNNFEMSFVMIDLDNFKRYNDQFGHRAGDEALKIVAQCLKENLRTHDVAARYGGEEFSLLLPQTSLSEAHLIAERVRQKIENTEFPHGNITVSVGVGAYSPLLLNTLELIVEAADKGLYEAKRIGKNNVQISLF